MKCTNKIELNLSETLPKDKSLNKSKVGCAPCLSEALNIKRKIGARALSEIKINEIKEIVNSLFGSKKK